MHLKRCTLHSISFEACIARTAIAASLGERVEKQKGGTAETAVAPDPSDHAAQWTKGGAYILIEYQTIKAASIV